MTESVLDGEMVLKRYPPFENIPPGNLPPPFRPGADPRFSNGAPFNPPSATNPYHSPIGRMVTYDNERGIEFATGFIVHPRIVLTAAHVVYDGYWKDLVLFQPAFNNGRPLQGFEKVGVINAFVPTSFIEHPSSGSDYAILIVDKKLPANLGRYKLNNLLPTTPFPIDAALVGYPSSINYLDQVKVEDLINWISEGTLGHIISAYPGQSGGPILTKNPGNPPIAVGIHSMPDLAASISLKVIAQFNLIKNQIR